MGLDFRQKDLVANGRGTRRGTRRGVEQHSATTTLARWESATSWFFGLSSHANRFTFVTDLSAF